MGWKLSFAALIASLVTMAPGAQANDFAFGGVGSAIQPLKETRVLMVSENIVLEQQVNDVRDGSWNVTADYRLHNKSTEDIVLNVGFPEFHCNTEEGDCLNDRFMDLKTYIDGVEVEVSVGQIQSNVIELTAVDCLNHL